MANQKYYYCPKCGKELSIEMDKDIKKDYPFYCKNCDENYYSIEAKLIK